MRKDEKTRQHIISKSAELFNQKGYAGSSIQDIIEATGLTKGGIYRRFSNKDEIAVEAFEYAGQVLMEQLSSAINNADTAIDKIMAVCNVHIDPVNNPPIKGGCPLLNTAVESDDTFPILRDKALAAYEEMLSLVQGILKHGISVGEFRSDVDVESLSSFIISSLEGSVMASKLSRDSKHVGFVMQQLRNLLNTYIEVVSLENLQ
ncbi:TetR/AcrR family transcriptional repressor of nem operon [Paenibacillus sp. V4I3]|uniref:TetR/AcrR family transcriptional regulator n=1 Tax=unclassified Paenibacillus TaxID=185978 RepID=UPI0027845223|nr:MULTISPECIES: TetR/AcrR family transcriptional regulator [unclassified Paenibacillus]MDQ0871430.1 TetR/AcrR family transcriptional repressor of nem operon [Paenibacillus sp. V4I3]MDQ0885256.1 TetR/AcrR family transcriptional repressor of nem operon [Paenibacillus sp. V4I9]